MTSSFRNGFSYLIMVNCLLLTSCIEKPTNHTNIENNINTSIVVLGTIQDGGSPHIGCSKTCCKDLFKKPDNDRLVVSLGLYDSDNNKKYLFDASPDFTQQIKRLKDYGKPSTNEIPDGIFLTHAHIGHYTGLMYLGKEASDAQGVNVYVMSRMKQFLETNGPWSQLVARKNIVLNGIKDELPVPLSQNLKVIPIQVPHRDEYSETVGYKIIGPNKSALFIPDIDKWEKWDKNIIEEIKKVDYAFLDATFYSGKEINSRDISQIPHPFIIESIKKFEDLSKLEKQKVIFIHFNHTNPVINIESKEAQEIINKGFKIATINSTFKL